MPIRSLLIIAALTATTAITTGCGSGESAAPISEAATVTTKAPGGAGPDLSAESFTDLTGESTVSVQARDNSFVKPYIEVSAGTVVEFTNKGRTQHNVIPVTDGAFAEIPTGDFEPKATDSITLTEPCDYAYYCSLHGTTTKGMVGAIRVLE